VGGSAEAAAEVTPASRRFWHYGAAAKLPGQK
jgi:hypothetical protein